MTKRNSLTCVLAFSFLFSAWGNVIAAAFCPRYLSQRASHHKAILQEPKQVEYRTSCHGMDDLKMSDSQRDQDEMASKVESSGGATLKDHQSQLDAETAQQAAIDRPLEACGHCWMHSQPPAGIASAVAINRANQSVDTQAPLPVAAITLPNTIPICILPLEHGPPGTAPPRHVLINVFRI